MDFRLAIWDRGREGKISTQRHGAAASPRDFSRTNLIRWLLAGRQSAANGLGSRILAVLRLGFERFSISGVVKVPGSKNRQGKPLMANAVKPSPSKSKWLMWFDGCRSVNLMQFTCSPQFSDRPRPKHHCCGRGWPDTLPSLAVVCALRDGPAGVPANKFAVDEFFTVGQGCCYYFIR
jgi:hypothetical protein